MGMPQESKQVFEVNFTEIDAGERQFQQDLADSFFVDSEAWGVYGGRIRAEVRARREGFLYFFSVGLAGHLLLECDRCLEIFAFPMGYEGELVVRRMNGVEEDYEGEEWTVADSVQSLDLAPYLRESLYLSIPMRHYHGLEGTDEGACNLELLETVQEEGSISRGLGSQLGEELAAARAKLAGGK